MDKPTPTGACLLEKLVGEHADRLFRLAYRLLGQTADAEDAVQQTFVIACGHLDQLRSPESAGAWLRQILRHEVGRLTKKRPTVDLAWLDNLEDQRVSSWELRVESEAVTHALMQLPLEFREPLVFFYFDDLLYREIAELCGVPLGTVMSRLARGKAMLRAILERDYAVHGRDVEKVDSVEDQEGPKKTRGTPEKRSSVARRGG